MTKQTLLTFEKQEFKAESKEMVEDKEAYPLEYCFNLLETEQCLWDMRHWKQKHNKEEVLEWIENREDMKNCGHVRFIINLMLDGYNISKEEIAEAILKNNNFSFENCLVPCGLNPWFCEKFTKQTNYGNNICSECDGDNDAN